MSRLLTLILKNIQHPPVTRRYPSEPRHYPVGTRGRLDIDAGRCDLCGLCARICPVGAIVVSVTPANGVPMAVNYDRLACIYCSRCAEDCPAGAIKVCADHPRPQSVR